MRGCAGGPLLRLVLKIKDILSIVKHPESGMSQGGILNLLAGGIYGALRNPSLGSGGLNTDRNAAGSRKRKLFLEVKSAWTSAHSSLRERQRPWVRGGRRVPVRAAAVNHREPPGG